MSTMNILDGQEANDSTDGKGGIRGSGDGHGSGIAGDKADDESPERTEYSTTPSPLAATNHHQYKAASSLESMPQFAVQPRRSLKRHHGSIDASEFDAATIFSGSGWAKVRRRNRSRDPNVAAAHEGLLRAQRRREKAGSRLVDAEKAWDLAREELEESRLEDARALECFQSSVEAFEAAERLEDPELRPDPDDGKSKAYRENPVRTERERNRNANFNEMLTALEAYRDRYGHLDFPRSIDPIPEGEPLSRAELAKLAKWMYRKKNNFKNLAKAGKKTTYPHHVMALQRLGVFEGRWERSLRQIQLFKERFGHADVPTKPTKWFGDSKLCFWVGTQRDSYRKLKDPKRAHLSQMTKERIELLESVGFQWATGKAHQKKARKIGEVSGMGDPEPRELVGEHVVI